MTGTMALTERWPVLGRHERAVQWLQAWADLGRAPRTIDAYARGLAVAVGQGDGFLGPVGTDPDQHQQAQPFGV